ASEDFDLWSVTFSPDSRYLLAHGLREAQFWDVDAGTPVGARMTWGDRGGSGGWVSGSFRADGKVVVTGGSPPRLWEVPTGRPLGAANSFLYAYFPVLTPDGKRLLIQPQAEFSETFGEVLDVAPGLEPSKVWPTPSPTFAVVASPDGQTFATVHWLEHIACRLWNARTGQAIGGPIEMAGEPNVGPMLPAYSPNGRTLSFGSGQNGFELRDTISGSRRGARFTTQSAVRALV